MLINYELLDLMIDLKYSRRVKIIDDEFEEDAIIICLFNNNLFYNSLDVLTPLISLYLEKGIKPAKKYCKVYKNSFRQI
jgi:hypothetical protein